MVEASLCETQDPQTFN